MTERSFAGRLHRKADKRGNPTLNYVLKLHTGMEIPMKQPGVHEGYGWTKDKVPDLSPFANKDVSIKALAYNESKDNKSVVVVRVTAVKLAK